MNLVFQAIEKTWYRRSPWSVLLLPLSVIYGALIQSRAAAYRFGALRRSEVGVPVIVVGNLTVGGSGKTPLVIRLVRYVRIPHIMVKFSRRNVFMRDQYACEYTGEVYPKHLNVLRIRCLLR